MRTKRADEVITQPELVSFLTFFWTNLSYCIESIRALHCFFFGDSLVIDQPQLAAFKTFLLLNL